MNLKVQKTFSINFILNLNLLLIFVLYGPFLKIFADSYLLYKDIFLSSSWDITSLMLATLDCLTVVR